MYADDTVIVSSDQNGDKAICDSYNIFAKVRDWCMLIRIKVNNNKTKHMLVGNKTKDLLQNLDGTEYGIVIVENFSYLGIVLDNRLTFEKCINRTISRVNGRLITLLESGNIWMCILVQQFTNKQYSQF